MQARLTWPSCSICCGITISASSTSIPSCSGLVGNIESPRFPHKYTLKQLSVLCEAFQYPFENLFLDEKETLLPYKERIKLLINKIIDYDG